MTDYKTLITELRAVEPTWHRGMYGCPRDMYADVKPLLDQAADALEAAETIRVDIDSLAQFIRRIDGDHTMGAGALAESIYEFLYTPEVTQ